MKPATPPAIYAFLSLSGTDAEISSVLNDYSRRGYDLMEIDLKRMKAVMAHACQEPCDQDHLRDFHWHCTGYDCKHGKEDVRVSVPKTYGGYLARD